MIEITTAQDIADSYTALEIDEEITRRINNGARATDDEITVLNRAYQTTRRLGI